MPLTADLTPVGAVAMLVAMRFSTFMLGSIVLLANALDGTLRQAAAAEPEQMLEYANEPWTGDLDGMTKRGFLRILTVHNPLFFAFDGEQQSGMVAELGKLFEEHLAEEIGRVRSPTVLFIPVSRNELIPDLVEGRGDLVMGNLTITPEREKLVDFGPPIHPDIDELVVTGPAAPDVASLDDLVPFGLYIRRSSSYYEHLQQLNAEREAQGKPPIPVTEADENLEDYDLLDMVNAGVLNAIVVDSHKAFVWEQVFDKIVVHRDIAVHSGTRIAWALRKDSPQLMRSISAFSEKVKQGSLLGNILRQRYLGDADWLDQAMASEASDRYDDVVAIIRRYAEQYGFDWSLITAQAYQESRFNQNKRSPAGAVGVMQLLPSTAADPAVGIPDIDSLENNIHAGIKYLHWLRETYYSDPAIEPLDRALFSLAAYNAGPGNMKRARRRARRLGFDPNRWFGNVEIGMFRAVSGEPAAYVRNIYKYYVTYQGLDRSRKAREKALGEHAESGTSLSGPLVLGGLSILLLGSLAFWLRRKKTG